MLTKKNKILGSDFQNEETQSQNQKQPQNKNFTIKKSQKKNHQIDDQIYFTESENTSPESIKGKLRIKNCYTNEPIRLYNWNQPIRQIENYTLTVIQHKNGSNEDNLEDSVLPFLIHPLTEARG